MAALLAARSMPPPATPPPAGPASPGPSPLFVLSDVHGHRDEFRAVLLGAGLVDRAGRWAGGAVRLWLLGDYVDRGPDGIGVIEDVRRLTAEAAAVGGFVGALLGNHEVRLLSAYRFGTAPVPGLEEPDGFLGGWLRHGGREHDLRRLAPAHVEWITRLPAAALVAGHLLVHSDTVRYLEFGAGVEAVNAAVSAALASQDAGVWREFTDRMRARGSFRGAEGPAAAARLLGALGGTTLVHGHSTLTRHYGIAPEDVREPLRYADGRVLAVGGGVHEGGRLLLTRLR
ncbi:metallophosphoesterase [Streptomyces sp. SPB074]|uniref:metallophosphoesterase n=1 Tax=Streptomyces sp. (strain SPB074) TaxID=465543 RepID=UPI0001D1DF54|nr:metallophosphoesterase [Streptomyces sp. SPB074]EDY44473.2 serine/threonine phosphatase [Streptomyces sp. SPB074]